MLAEHLVKYRILGYLVVELSNEALSMSSTVVDSFMIMWQIWMLHIKACKKN